MTKEDSILSDKRLCDCGCGREVTGLNHTTHEPVRFVRGHNNFHQFGDTHNAWKGGRYVNPKGYVRIYRPDHPRSNSHGFVAEHIAVLEDKLGRRLRKNEHAHHLNGIKNDNRPENLTNVMKDEHARLHTLGRRKDMSNRTCVDCGRGVEKVGRIWLRAETDGQFRCRDCYYQIKRNVNKNEP